MRYKFIAATALGLGLLIAAQDNAQAQASGTNLGTPQTQPMPGGGVDRGPGAPTNALNDIPQAGRGAPSPGTAAPTPNGSSTGGSNLAPSGAVRPGSTPGGTGTGGNSGGSGG